MLSILKGDICSKGVESNIRDFDRLTNQWGIGFKFLNAEDFLQEISGLDAQELERAGALADELMAQARTAHLPGDAGQLHQGVRGHQEAAGAL